MEEGNEKRRSYRKEVEDFLGRRHIKKTVPTLEWLRTQKMQSLNIKRDAADNARMEVGVLDEMISESKEGDK